jgi:hypothetical protein
MNTLKEADTNISMDMFLPITKPKKVINTPLQEDIIVISTPGEPMIYIRHLAGEPPHVMEMMNNVEVVNLTKTRDLKRKRDEEKAQEIKKRMKASI